MNASRFLRGAVASALVLSAASALGASDYLLEIKGVAGDSGASGAQQSIEISSFSWGTSNPTSVGSGGLSAGKVSMQDMSVTSAGARPASVQTAREAGSGMATGKQASAAAAVVSPTDGSAVAPKVGDVATMIVTIRESPTLPSKGKTSQVAACTPGQHINDVVLTGQGKRYEMHDVVVTACSSANGERRKELTGHVTLIK